MNEYLPSQELETLIAHQGKPAVSIFLPTTRIPTRVQAESLQFRHLVRDAEAQLGQFALRTPEIRAMVEPAHQLIADPEFWRHQRDGLAVFLSEAMFVRYQLPISFEMEVVVADSFHLKPLMPLLSNEIVFYVLAVSQNQVRLLRCTRFTVEEIDPATVPGSLQEILSEYDIEKQVQYHNAALATGTGRQGSIFYSAGGVENADEKAKIREYFGRIDQGLRDYFQDQSAPVVFAGVDYLFPIYREANTYANLLESSIMGNPEELQAGELHRRAWRLIEPTFTAKQNADIERFHSSAPHGLASTDLEELVPWADKGRIETAFIDKEAMVWGVYDQGKFKTELHATHTAKNRDLTDLVALYTLLRKGNVYLLTPEQMEMEFGPNNRHISNNGASPKPASHPTVAAIYRFAV